MDERVNRRGAAFWLIRSLADGLGGDATEHTAAHSPASMEGEARIVRIAIGKRLR